MSVKINVQNHRFARRFPDGHRCRRRAAATLEFALVFPILLLIVLGVIEFSKAFLTEHMLTLATREAARVAALEGTTIDQIHEVLHSYLTPSRVPPEVLEIQIDPPDLSATETGDWVTVSVSVRFEHVSLLSTPFFLPGKVLEASCTMRRE